MIDNGHKDRAEKVMKLFEEKTDNGKTSYSYID